MCASAGQALWRSCLTRPWRGAVEFVTARRVAEGYFPADDDEQATYGDTRPVAAQRTTLYLSV